jgi:hypothetical protein
MTVTTLAASSLLYPMFLNLAILSLGSQESFHSFQHHHFRKAKVRSSRNEKLTQRETQAVASFVAHYDQRVSCGNSFSLGQIPEADETYVIDSD